MMTRQKTLWFTLLLIGLYTSFLNASEITRWVITSPDSICWRVNGVHNDHIEMSGLKVSTVLRYGVNEAGEWVIDRNMVLPTFRTIPNAFPASSSLSGRYCGIFRNSADWHMHSAGWKER